MFITAAESKLGPEQSSWLTVVLALLRCGHRGLRRLAQRSRCLLHGELNPGSQHERRIGRPPPQPACCDSWLVSYFYLSGFGQDSFSPTYRCLGRACLRAEVDGHSKHRCSHSPVPPEPFPFPEHQGGLVVLNICVLREAFSACPTITSITLPSHCHA